MIYMTHPMHGATHVLNEIDAVEAEKRGWVRTKEPTGDEVRASKGIKPDVEPEAKADEKPQPKYRGK
jgi:hypothetical protein